MINHHPTLYSARPPRRSTQTLSHHHMRVQAGAGQAFPYQGSSGARTPFNPSLHHGVHHMPVTVNPLHGGGPRPLLPSYNVCLCSSCVLYILIKLAH
jgi:hypothetical protein